MKPDTHASVLAQIIATEAEIDRLNAQGPTPDEIRTHVRAFCANTAAQGAARLSAMVASESLTEALIVRSTHTGSAPGTIGPAVDLAPLLAALLGPERVADTLLAGIEDLVPDGLPAVDRAARLAELRRELLRLGHIEEDLIEAAALAGTPIARRPRADPAVVLRTHNPTRKTK